MVYRFWFSKLLADKYFIGSNDKSLGNFSEMKKEIVELKEKEQQNNNLGWRNVNWKNELKRKIINKYIDTSNSVS